MPIRVFELARELGISSKEMSEKCRAAGFEVKGHMSVFDDHQSRLVRAMFPPPSPEEIAEREAEEQKRKEKAAKRKAAAAAKKAKKEAEEAAAIAAAEEAAKLDAEQLTGIPAEPADEQPVVEEAPAEPVFGVIQKAPQAEQPVEEAAPDEEPADAEEDDGTPPVIKPILNFPRIGLVKPAPEQETPAKPAPPAEIKEEKPVSKGRGNRPVAPEPDQAVLDSIPRTVFRRDRRRRQRPRRPNRRGRGGRVKTRFADANVAPTALETGKADVAVPITVRSLSEALGVKTNSLLQAFMAHEMFPTINDVIPEDVAQLVALDFSVDLTIKKGKDLEDIFAERVDEGSEASDEEDLVSRAPVVAFLGHVDHGKTSLLDAIREANVVDSESGGITQHIGAYTAQSSHGPVTFLDTPGHQAFTEMRARGANATDIVVLVVAADDGVMPQTEEAISHAKAAGVSLVVALNKIDLPNANVPKVKQQLASFDVQIEEWGGDVGLVETSAEKGEGVSELIERLALEAEILELRGDPTLKASGVVLEGRLDPGRGVVANVLVRNGTLRKGDVILSGGSFGRARAILNDRGEEVEEVGPSTPIEVTGLGSVPEAGATFHVMSDADEARKIAEQRQVITRQDSATPARRMSLEAFFSEAISAAGNAELALIIKADVKGSLEVIAKEVQAIETDEAKVKIVHSSLGGINVTDVALAEASEAVIMGFHVGVDAEARRDAEAKGVDIRLHRVIYDLVDEVKKSLEGRLAPEEREIITGHAEVREVFAVSRAGTIAGSFILDGLVTRTDRARVARDGQIVFEGRIASLRRFKDDAREVRENFECGIKIDGFDDLKKGDQIETYRIEEIARTLG